MARSRIPEHGVRRVEHPWPTKKLLNGFPFAYFRLPAAGGRRVGRSCCSRSSLASPVLAVTGSPLFHSPALYNSVIDLDFYSPHILSFVVTSTAHPRKTLLHSTLPSLFCTLLQERKRHLHFFQPLPHSCSKTPGVASRAFIPILERGCISFDPRSSDFQPSTVDFRLVSKSRRIRTYKNRVCKSFRIRTYEKPGEGAALC